MTFPKKLIENINTLLDSYHIEELKLINEQLSHAYRTGRWHLSQKEKLCYAICRMPATYAVISHLLTPLSFHTLLDVGAGPGTASWAVSENIDVTAIEHDEEFIALGKLLGSRATWNHRDFRTFSPSTLFDLVLFSYSLGEVLHFDLTPFFNCCAQTLVIIEPGTPKGWQTILQAREQCLKLGGYIHAPCSHALTCPLQPPDWCHFGIRLDRSPLHRLLKEGSLSFEEEKFSYLIVGKSPVSPPMRILRPPQKRSGHVHLKLCTPHGVQHPIISKRSQEEYHLARHAHWGNPWPPSQ